jgi:signal transduction histidine kinase
VVIFTPPGGQGAPDDKLFRSAVESVTDEDEFIASVSHELRSPLNAIIYKNIRNRAHIADEVIRGTG